MIRIRYRIDENFDGTYNAYQVRYKRQGRWPFRSWALVHIENLYQGDRIRAAEKAVEDRVKQERNGEIKNTEWYNASGVRLIDPELH